VNPTDGQSSHPSPEQNVQAPNDAIDPGDQDIDTAATNVDDELASERGELTTAEPIEANVAYGDAIDNDATPIGPHDPASMPRAEDDAEVLERSPEFHDRPGSGKYR
jgi:hypothetical protein